MAENIADRGLSTSGSFFSFMTPELAKACSIRQALGSGFSATSATLTVDRYSPRMPRQGGKTTMPPMVIRSMFMVAAKLAGRVSAVPMSTNNEEANMRTAVILYALILLMCARTNAAWVPVDCKDRMKEIQQLHKERGVANVEGKWQAYLEAVREARPGSPVYAPHPFPKKADEIIADFRHAYFDRLFEGTPFEKLPPREQFVYKALKENRLRIEIVRVEN